MKRAVVDQSGLKVVFLGLILSIFIGLVFRSQIKPTVVKAKLENSLLKLQKDINIDFEKVDVQLSDWGIPRPVVEIKGIRISPLKNNCRDNQIYIESLSFPISYNLLFNEKKTINSIRISLMEVRLNNLDSCLQLDLQSQKIETRVEDQNQFANQSIVQKIVTGSRTHLKDINIDRLRFIDSDQLKSSVDFNAMQISVDYIEQKLHGVNIQSQLLMFKDPIRNLYLLKSEIKMNIILENREQPQLTADISGLILDRPVKVKIKTDTEKSTLNLFGELNAISLKALNYLIKSEKPKINIYDFLSGMTLSGFVTGEYSFKTKNSAVVFNKMKILFGHGSAEMSDLVIKKDYNQEWRVKPFDIQLNHVDLTKFLAHSYFDQIRPSIENAGQISGLVQFDQDHRFKMNSLLENVSFYFSNQGVRVTQVFDRFNMKLNYDFDKLDLIFNDFILNDEKISGQIKYQSQLSKPFRSLAVELKGPLLSADTMKLFTGESYRTPIELTLSTDFTSRIQCRAQIQELKIQNMTARQLKLDYEKNIATQAENIQLNSPSLRFDYVENRKSILNQFFDLKILDKNKFDAQMLRVNLEKNQSRINFEINSALYMEDATLKKMNFYSDVKYDGVIDNQMNIESQLFLKLKNKKNMNYKLNGFYDRLELSY